MVTELLQTQQAVEDARIMQRIHTAGNVFVCVLRMRMRIAYCTTLRPIFTEVSPCAWWAPVVIPPTYIHQKLPPAVAPRTSHLS
jgi:hypothetical protein